FRLLTLLPALKFEETIQCTVDDYELDDPTRPPHKALSYLWGDPSRTIPMLLQGKTANITENLHEALQYVRKNDRKIILWVDALCIDQQNIHERTAQVSQMRDIYTGADEVLAWLG
ncbi:HET-domain-containing protein, partial [Glonium stellatum]